MDIGAAENDEQREATYRFLNDEISAEHARLMEEARGMDTKATVVAGFAAAAISFLLDSRRGALWWTGLAFYMASFTVALAVMWPRRWDGLTPSAVRDELGEAAPVFVVGQVAGSKVLVYERNQLRARTKALLWVLSVLLLAGGIGFSVWSTISEATR